MRRTNKKGFTIVELVIVIAVIAILAAVLIPNISKLVRKANASSDLSLVRNLNTALAVENKTYATAYEAFEAVKDAGYDLTKIEAKASGSQILFDSANQCFAYLDNGELKYYPNSTKSNIKTPNHQLWAIVTEVTEAANSTYSVYWNGANNAEITVNGVGFDAGDKIVASVNFTGTDAGKNVVIRTNSFETTLEVDTTGSVSHYGDAGKLEIVKVATSSYHEFGNARFANLKAGNFVAEKGSNVTLISTMDGTTVKVDAAATVEVVAGKADVTDSTNKVMVMKVEGEIKDSGEDKTVALVKSGDEVTPKSTLASEDWTSGYTIVLLDDVKEKVTISGNTTVIGNMTTLSATIEGSGNVVLKNLNSKGIYIGTSFTGHLTFDGGLLEGKTVDEEGKKAENDKLASIYSLNAGAASAKFTFKNLSVKSGTLKGIKIKYASEVVIENCVFNTEALTAGDGTLDAYNRSLSAIDIDSSGSTTMTKVIIKGCTFKNIGFADQDQTADTAGAIKIKGQGGSISGVVIENNTFENCCRDIVIGTAKTADTTYKNGNYSDVFTIRDNTSTNTAESIKDVSVKVNNGTNYPTTIGEMKGGCAVFDVAYYWSGEGKV